MGQVLFTYFGNVIFYILTVGGFYGILHQIDGYRNLLNKIVAKFKNKEESVRNQIITNIEAYQIDTCLHQPEHPTSHLTSQLSRH
mgnify:CR=1 FL=1